MKKKLLTLMLVGAMATSMVACGGKDAGETGSTGDATNSTSEGGHELTVYAWDANFNIPALQAAEADYKANVDADFTLNIVEQPNSDAVRDAIRLAAESDDYSNLPDIVLFQDHQFQGFVTAYPDAWVDASTATCDWSDFGAEKLSYSTLNNVHYGFPVDNGTAIFAYRTDILADAGYTIDDLTGCTWDQFIEIGKKVQETSGKYLLSMDGSGNDLFYMMLQAEGVSQFKDGEPNLANNAQLAAVMDVLKRMVDEKVLYLANDWGDYCDQTIKGDMVAGVMNGNWIIPTIEQVPENSGLWEITTLPTLNGGEGYAANGGSSLYVTSNCANKELAIDFLSKTFGGSSATYDEALLKGGVITTCISAGKSDVYNQGVDYFNGQAIYTTIVEYGAHVQVIEQNDFHYDCRSELGAALQSVIDGADIQEALTQAEQNLRFTMNIQ